MLHCHMSMSHWSQRTTLLLFTLCCHSYKHRYYIIKIGNLTAASGKYRNIHEAVRNCDVIELESMVNSGGSINEVDKTNKFTPLHWATYCGSLECVHWLLWHGADTSDATPHGWTALHIAGIRGRDACAQALSKHGSDMNAVDMRGNTAAHLAAAHGNAYTLQTFLRHGTDLKTADRNGWTALHTASYHGRLNCVQILHKWGSDLTDADHNGNTAGHLAAMEGHVDLLKYLVCNLPDISYLVVSRNDHGETPVDMAQQYGKKSCTVYLAEVEFQKQHPEQKENLAFPAHVASLTGDLEHLRMLVEQGIVGINELDDKGSTPAHKAAGNGHLRVLQWLLEMGADMTIENSAGEIACDVARRFAHLACVKLLWGSTEDEGEGDSASVTSPSDPGTGNFDAVNLTAEQKNEARGRGLKRIEELNRMMNTAKFNYRQLGGELQEDKLKEDLLSESERVIADLEAQLEYERLKRESLESQIDELRVELGRVNQELTLAQTALLETMNDEADLKSKKKPKRRGMSDYEKTSGVFVQRNVHKQ